MEFGVNLNNREPLITSDYTLADLLDLAELAEQRGFGSVWVGDSLFSKPRYEPISLLSAISQRTSRARLGTACLVTSTRNPLYLALEWATLDQMSGGRTVLGACMGNPEHGVRREFEALGLPFGKRAAIFEEGLAVLRSLWTTGTVTHHGEYYDFDDVSFWSGTEMGPLMPMQQPPPTWVVSNIRLTGDLAPEVARRRMRDSCARVIKYGKYRAIEGGAEARRLLDVITGVPGTETVAEFAFGTSDFAPVGDPSEKGRKGTVHFALGDNQNCYPGGQNSSVLHLDAVCHNVALQILDTGEYIAKDGVWQL